MPLKVATINVNGIRAAFKNGMADWLSENADIDVFALQEVRAETKDLVDLFEANPPAKGTWHFSHDAASAKGRAGVAIVSKVAPVEVRTKFGPDSFDSAGRWLEADFKVGSKVVRGAGRKVLTITALRTGEGRNLGQVFAKLGRGCWYDIRELSLAGPNGDGIGVGD